MRETTLIANAKKQALHEHLYAVAVLARHISTFKTDNTNIQQCSFFAGLFSGIGKINAPLQGKYTKGSGLSLDGEHIDSGPHSFKKHARHNELSVWTFALIAGSDRESKKRFLRNNGFSDHNVKLIDLIKHAIYWHHPKPFRKQDFQDLGAIQKQSIQNTNSWCDTVNALLAKIEPIFPATQKKQIRIMHDDIAGVVEDISKELLPAYKTYRLDHAGIPDYREDIYYNSCCNIVRASVVCAKNIISQLSHSELSNVIQSGRIEQLFQPHTLDGGLVSAITRHSVTFHPGTEQTKNQQRVAFTLAKKDIIAAISSASASGKTKIALEWAKERSAEKIYWIVPRVSVGLGVYDLLKSPEYLPDCRVEIFTGDHKLNCYQGVELTTSESDYLQGQVVITTIDQLVNSISTHRHINIFTDFMLNHAVFDEFHELFNIDALNLLFAEIVESKMHQTGAANILLMSTTPNYSACDELLGINEKWFTEIPSSNTSRYEVSFEDFSDDTPMEQHPTYRAAPNESIVISNMATRAQQSYLRRYMHEHSLLLHAKYASEDRQELFREVLANFGRHRKPGIQVLRSSSIVQNSLDITCRHMITEATTAENMLQRIGRLDRFCEFNDNKLIVAVPVSVRHGKITDNDARFLNSTNSFRSTVAWIQHLSSQPLLNVQANDMYAIYKAFHRIEKYRRIVLADLSAALKQSALTISQKLCDPLDAEPKENTHKTLKRVSLRGDSRYVQMIRASYADGKHELKNEYAFSHSNTMTISVSEFESGADSPLLLMSRKHHIITGVGSKYGHSPAQLKELARDKSTPIFTSYTPAELAQINEINSPSAIVYVSSEKQLVGCMRIQSLLDTCRQKTLK